MAWVASTALRNAWLDAIDTQLGANAKWRIYDSTPTLLAEGLFNAAAALQAATGGTITFNTIGSEADAPASGTPSYIELLTSGDVVVLTGDCNETAGADAILDEATITITDVVGWSAANSIFNAGNA